MAMLKVKDPADPTGNTWLDITGTGQPGPPGGPVPVGGNPGEVIQKTGPADFEVGWVERPRVVLENMIATSVTSATVNTMTTFVSGNVTLYTDRYYHFFASIRAIQDLGVGGNAQFRVTIGTVNLQGYDVVACTDPNSLWGAWSQNWLHPGTVWTTGNPIAVDVRLDGMCSIASRTVYNPRLYIIEY